MVLDSSLVSPAQAGPVPLTLDIYELGPDQGRLIGGKNLFFSFAGFKLDTGETARFSGPAGLANVLARVTGPDPSRIDGSIRVQSGANFVFINPNGVVFGPASSLDVTGAVVISTADFVRFADGSEFAAIPGPADDLLTVAAPAAFGFLGARPAAPVALEGPEIVPQGSRPALAFRNNGAFSIIAGDVRFTGRGLNALRPRPADQPAGPARINLVSVASAGVATLNPADVNTAVQTAFEAYGVVEMIDADLNLGAQQPGNTQARSGGSVKIHAGDVSITRGAVITETFDRTIETGIELDLTGDLRLTRGTLSTTGRGNTGNAGDVDISARSMTVDGEGGAALGDRFFFGVAADTAAGGSGTGGDVHVDLADTLHLVNSGRIAAFSLGGGPGGTISVLAGNILLEAGAAETDTGILAQAKSFGSARGGNILIGSAQRPVDSLRVMRGAIIDASTVAAVDPLKGSSAAGGNVEIYARDVELDGTGAFVSTGTDEPGIFAAARPPELTPPPEDDPAFDPQTLPRGPGGDILLNVSGALDIRNGARVDAATQTSANGGSVRVVGAGPITITGGDNQQPTGIFTNARLITAAEIVPPFGQPPPSSEEMPFRTGLRSGDGGNITVEAGSLEMSGVGAEITASTAGEGKAGEVLVTVAGDAALTGPGAAIAARTSAVGVAGNVEFTAGSISLGDGAEVTSESTGEGDGQTTPGKAGSVTVRTTGDFLAESGATVSVASQSAAAAGTITVASGGDLTLDGANVTAKAGGDGGNVRIGATGMAVIRGGSVVSARSINGNGGRIGIGAEPETASQSQTASAAQNGADAPVAPRVLDLSGDSRIEAGAQQGTGGDVALRAADEFRISDAAVSAKADVANGGNIRATAGRRISLSRALIDASAPAGDGGTIVLEAPESIHISDNSEINALAGAEGRLITLGPGIVTLVDSLIEGTAAGEDVLVTVTSPLLFSSNSEIRSDNVSLPPETDVTESLARLPGDVADVTATLQATCGMEAGGQFSTFIAVGGGGLPARPDVPWPAFEIRGLKTTPTPGLGSDSRRLPAADQTQSQPAGS